MLSVDASEIWANKSTWDVENKKPLVNSEINYLADGFLRISEESTVSLGRV